MFKKENFELFHVIFSKFLGEKFETKISNFTKQINFKNKLIKSKEFIQKDWRRHKARKLQTFLPKNKLAAQEKCRKVGRTLADKFSVKEFVVEPNYLK